MRLSEMKLGSRAKAQCALEKLANQRSSYPMPLAWVMWDVEFLMMVSNKIDVVGSFEETTYRADHASLRTNNSST